MSTLQEIKALTRFYGISEFDLFYLSLLWFLESVPDDSVSFVNLKEDFSLYLRQRKVPFYVREFVRTNPLVKDNGKIVAEWIPILEALKRGDPRDRYLITWETLCKLRVRRERNEARMHP